MLKVSKTWVSTLIAIVLVASAVVVFNSSKVSAACSPSGDFGSVTFNNVSVPATGTYRVWSRIQIPNANSNNYMLEINGTCHTVGGNGSISANTWTWVDYSSGGSKINAQLNQGNQTVKMFGTSDGVLLDRVIFTMVSGSSTCTPTGTGDNCANPPDATAPVVNITSPVSSASVSGTVSVAATATDDRNVVSKVDFFLDGSTTAISSSTSAPYSFQWDTTKVADGSHTLVAKAYDPSGNVGTSSSTIVAVSNGKPDFVVTNVSMSPSSPKVGDKITLGATVKNQGSVTGAPGNIKFEVGSTTVGTVASTAGLAAGGTRTIQLNATWTAVAGTHNVKVTVDSSSATTESNENNNVLTSAISVDNPDVTPPVSSVTSPAANATVSGVVDITANTSDAGGSGLSRLEFHIDYQPVQTQTSAPFKYSWDTTKIGNGQHVLYVVAVDNAGNKQASAEITVNVLNEAEQKKSGDANGDGRVDIIDRSILSSNWKASGKTWAQGDFNGDGRVDIIDLSILSSNWKK